MTVAVVWFRRDLRMTDNYTLHRAATESSSTYGVFVLDPVTLRRAGELRLRYLLSALFDLNEQMDGRLNILYGDPAKEVANFCEVVGAEKVFVSSDVSHYSKWRDGRVRDALIERLISFEVCDYPTTFIPRSICKGDGTPYQVFTPYFKAWLAKVPEVQAPPKALVNWEYLANQRSIPLRLSSLLPYESGGERKELEKLETFVQSTLERYEKERDFPSKSSTSRLSAALHFGVIHPRTIVLKLDVQAHRRFLSELCWRDFFAETLELHPESSWRNLNSAFDTLEVSSAAGSANFEAWKSGVTGYPIVDAGMRQLLREGYIHNRVRMIAASFLVKDLHIHWKEGAKYFFERLIDGDVASNSHGWQWVAGTGRDAAPYYRIFNPTTQGKRFDPNGEYVKTYVEELRSVPESFIHEPWLYANFGGLGYPLPVVDHQVERAEALRRLESIKRDVC